MTPHLIWIAARRVLAIRWRSCSAALLVTWAFAGGDLSFRTFADDPTPQAVRKLIEAFSSPDRAIRTAAERELYELGPEVLPHLPPPARLQSPAAQDAVRRVREVLEREQAERSVRPSQVTLTGRFMLRELFDRIATQTGNDIRMEGLASGDRTQPLTVQWDARSFWDCIDDIEQQADVSVRFSPLNGRLEAVPDAEVAQQPIATANAGAFRITVDSVNVRADFTNAKRSLFRMKYTVAAEPRLRPLFVRMAAADFAMLGNDARFLPLNPDAQLERPVRDRGPVALSTDFVVPRSQPQERVTIVGRLEIEVAVGQEPIVFRNLESAEHVVRRRGGVSVTLDRADFSSEGNDDGASMRIAVRVAYDQGGPAFESHRTWVYHNDAYLRAVERSANSEIDRWPHSGFDTLAAEEAAVKLSYRFRDIPSDPQHLEFVYVAPTLLITAPVKLELKNVPVQGIKR